MRVRGEESAGLEISLTVLVAAGDSWSCPTYSITMNNNTNTKILGSGI